MAGVSEQSFDAERTVVVLNFPSNIGEDELTIHFQKAKHGGGDVDDVVIDESVAFVTFDMPQVATSVLRSEQIMNGCKLNVNSYTSWMASKKKQDSPVLEDSELEDARKTTVYVSGLKESITKDAVTLFFENKKRTRGGELREGKEGYKRISDAVARLTFVSSKVSQMVLKKASETPLYLEGNLLKVSDVFEPTHDRSILLAKNLNPKTSKETLQNFVEVKKLADVFNIVYGKGDKAIVILKSEIGEYDSEEEKSSCEDKETKLDESIISLEFCPLTKGIQISNIPPETSQDDIKYKFSNPKIGGGKVTDMMFDKKNGVANVYFEKSSVVSGLVKRTHTLKDVPLTVIPYYDGFEEQQERTTTKSEYSGEHHLDPAVIYYIMNKKEIEKNFDFKALKFNKNTSQLHFTGQFDDPKDDKQFKNKLKEDLHSFVKEEVKMPKGVFEEVKKGIKGKRDENEEDGVDFSFEGLPVTFVGNRKDVVHKKQEVETMVDKFTEEAQMESTKFSIEDKNKLKFLNSIDYFKNLMREFPDVRIHGIDGTSGNLSLLGTAEKIRDVKLRILEDLAKISETEIKMSDRQINFLCRTNCEIVNAELKKDDVMLMLLPVKSAVGAKALQAKILSLKKCDDNEETRIENIVFAKTSEKCKTVDEETASFFSKLNKLEEFKREQFDKHQVLIDQELTNPCNIWIVCEKSKMNKAENELASVTDEKKIESCIFKRVDPTEIRFLKNHCWGKIKEKEKSCKAEGVAVIEIDSDSLEIKGTQAGRKEMIIFLQTLAENIYFKEYQLNEPGMKKTVNMDATSAVISEIEKNHHCVIEQDNNDSDSAIVARDLAHQQVRFIATSMTDDKVDLNAYPREKTSLKVAGKEVRKIRSVISGSMASTGPAKACCKRVYHVHSSRSKIFGSVKTAVAGDRETTIKIYSDNKENIKKAWEDLKRNINESIQEKPMNDEVIKKFTDAELEKLRKLESVHDVKIKVDRGKGKVLIKGHIADISTIQEEIRTILKNIRENEQKVPDNWDMSRLKGVHKVNLPTNHKDYQDVEAAFRKTAANPIVRIERIQNKGIYELYNVKRQAMMNKYGSNFRGKELMLFHGTSAQNIEKINSGGLNQRFTGIHGSVLIASLYSKGVYFTRDASRCCSRAYSPPDTNGHRYMYYAKVLVGEYTTGNSSMIVPPSKNSGNPNETYESVVDNPANPSIYVLFKDYEYYTEYLITFK